MNQMEFSENALPFYDKRNPTKPDIQETYRSVMGLNLPIQVYMPKVENRFHDTAIVCIHGGGWRTGIQNGVSWTGGDMVHQARYFSMLGFTGICISYRSLDNAGADILDLISDCAHAVRYIREACPFVDPDKIVLWGDSAGAHLAACLGMEQDDRVRPKLVIACNPVLDCVNRFRYASEKEENRIAASPILQKPKQCAQFFLVHGDADRTTPLEDSIRFCDNLNALGHDAALCVLKNVAHAFILYNYRSTDDQVMEYMRLIYRYLQKHL